MIAPDRVLPEMGERRGRFQQIAEEIDVAHPLYRFSRNKGSSLSTLKKAQLLLLLFNRLGGVLKKVGDCDSREDAADESRRAPHPSRCSRDDDHLWLAALRRTVITLSQGLLSCSIIA